MEGAIKHSVWAASLAACVYFASTNQWAPLQLSIAAQQAGAGAQRAAGTGAGGAAEPIAQVAQAQRIPEFPPAAAMAGLPATGQPGVPAPVAGDSARNGSLATIEDPKVARQATEALAKLEGVLDVPEGTPEGRIATIFFDPRCPYCHAAFKAMHGKVAARWVPVAVLGEPEVGAKMAAIILSAPDRVAALTAAFVGQNAPTSEGNPEMVKKVTENRDAFAGIFAASPNLRPGVPTMFVPRPDGRLAIMVGYEAGDEAKLLSVLAGS